MEQRDRQNLDLNPGTQLTRSGRAAGHKRNGCKMDPLLSGWIRIGIKAQDRHVVFGNLHTHINVDSLREAFKALDGKKALGVDKVSKAEFGKNLEANLENLARRVQRGSYRPKPKREVHIPKANGKTRPLAIACFEDKLVDWVVGKILSAVFEPLFIRNSFGYRPNKSADDAIKACYYSLCKDKRQHIVEIDFSSFFNTIPHRKLMKVLGKRISDKRFKGLIGRFLKGDLLTVDGETLPSQLGTPQGSIMSPVLANVYLNEVIDQWFITTYASYNNIITRYADDAIFFFKEEALATKFLEGLKKRVSEYGLRLNEDKTRTLKLTKSNHEDFDFLGFTFYWGKQGSRTLLKVKTQKEKLIKSIQEFDQWIKQNRNTMKLKDLWARAKAKIQGHVNYFGYWMNATKLHHFYIQATRSLFKWLNRRSQKRSYSWEGFMERIKYFPLTKGFTPRKLKTLGASVYVR